VTKGEARDCFKAKSRPACENRYSLILNTTLMDAKGSGSLEEKEKNRASRREKHVVKDSFPAGRREGRAYGLAGTISDLNKAHLRPDKKVPGSRWTRRSGELKRPID